MEKGRLNELSCKIRCGLVVRGFWRENVCEIEMVLILGWEKNMEPHDPVKIVTQPAESKAASQHLSDRHGWKVLLKQGRPSHLSRMSFNQVLNYVFTFRQGLFHIFLGYFPKSYKSLKPERQPFAARTSYQRLNLIPWRVISTWTLLTRLRLPAA